ncbi:hypothetical protein BC940DRAFT_289130 [Gongronella butleri]|nr:hypothetical protein BC940DRAFT_289130 [Gongronella butleri]
MVIHQPASDANPELRRVLDELVDEHNDVAGLCDGLEDLYNSVEKGLADLECYKSIDKRLEALDARISNIHADVVQMKAKLDKLDDGMQKVLMCVKKQLKKRKVATPIANGEASVAISTPLCPTQEATSSTTTIQVSARRHAEQPNPMKSQN